MEQMQVRSEPGRHIFIIYGDPTLYTLFIYSCARQALYDLACDTRILRDVHAKTVDLNRYDEVVQKPSRIYVDVCRNSGICLLVRHDAPPT